MADQTPHSAPVPPVPPLIGRDREQATLRDALAAALAGRGSLVLIGGEAGIGKTALAEWLLAEAAEQGATVLVGRCYDLAETPPYGPWREAFDHAPGDPELPTLPSAVLHPEREGEASSSQEAIIRRVRDYLASLAARQPLVLLFDDLHWADPASLDALRVIGRGLGILPLLAIATYRDDAVAPEHPLNAALPSLVREARAIRLDLRPLDEAALGGLVATRYALGGAERHRLARYLVDRTEGNALFVGEVLRTLEHEGLLRQAGGRWALGDLAAAPVPALLRQVIAGRAAQLPAESGRLLSLAAVIGQEVSLALWAAVADTDEDELLDTVERAAGARLLEARPDGAAVRFAHALVRETLYDGVLPPRRRALHRRIAEALIAGPAAASGHPADPDAIAHHFQRAGDDRAITWLEAAGERARRTYAWVSAADRLEAALRALERRGADPGERGWLLLRIGLLRRHSDMGRATSAYDAASALAAEASDARLAAYARFNAGLLRGYVGDYRTGVAAMSAAVAALDALPPPDETTRTRLRGWGLADDAAHHRGTLALWLAVSGRPAEGQALGERALPVAMTTEHGWLDGGFAPNALLGLGIALAIQGHPAEALAAVEAHLAARHASGDLAQIGNGLGVGLRLVVLPYLADNPAVRERAASEFARVVLPALGSWVIAAPGLWDAPLLLLEGRWAELHARLAAVGAAGPGDRGWWNLLEARIPLALYQGDPDQARSLVRRSLPAIERGVRNLRYDHVASFLLLAAAAALAAGALAESRDWLARHDALLAGAGAVLGRADNHLGWAAFHRVAGDLAAAREEAERALARASEPRQPLALLAAHRLLGELDTASGRHTEGRAHLDTALALAEACAAPHERALTLLALGELHAAGGAREEAAAMVGHARAMLGPLGARPSFARADALAQQLATASTASPVAGASPFGLTAREAEVLRLVAAGLTDADIAARLFISRHTVGGHTKAIYSKLGVTTRAAATRLALDHGLR